MSFEFLKELVALASAIISFTTALSSGKLMQRTYGAVEPIKWGAVCFVLGGAFVGAVVFVLREQQFAPIGADPLIQWSGVLGFAGAVLGLITTHFVKKDVDEIGHATLQGNDVAYAQPKPQEQIRVVYVRDPTPHVIGPPIDWDAVAIFSIVCGTIAFIALLIFLYSTSPMAHFR